MVIGIIGASISGLIAGKRLAKAGHDVTVIEKSRSLGGRLATINMDGINLDYGISHLVSETNTLQDLIDELERKGDITEWFDELSLHDGNEFHETDPNSLPRKRYVGTNGIQSVTQSLVRWVDVKSSVKAGGLTYIGPDTTKKRSWMINLTDITVFECDAVILATPATEAYGLLLTAQDETAAKRIIRYVDDINYNGCISIAATYDHERPDWKGIECEHNSLRWIGNESSKQGAEKAGLVIRSSPHFYRKYAQVSDNKIQELLLEEASKIVDPWVLQPKSTHIHRWRYFQPRNTINEYFMELEMDEAPLALIGDYLGDGSVEDAFISGYNLAEYWINKYSEVKA